MAFSVGTFSLTNKRNLPSLVNKRITKKPNSDKILALVPVAGKAGYYTFVPISDSGIFLGISTGQIANHGSLIYCEIKTNVSGANGTAWLNTDSVNSAANTSASSNTQSSNPNPQSPNSNPDSVWNKQKLLDQCLKNDFELYHRLLMNYKNIVILKAKGIDIQPFMDKGMPILTQYNARQKWIEDNCTDVKKSHLPKFEDEWKAFSDAPFDWNPDLYKSWLSGIEENNLGVIPVIIWIVVVIVAAAIGGGVAYYALSPKFEEGKRNLKECKELEDMLAKADPKTRKKIEDDLNAQLDNAYNAGKNKQWWKDNSSWITNLGLIAGGGILVIWGIPKIMETMQKKTKSK